MSAEQPERPGVEHLRDRIQRDALSTRRDYLRLLVTVSGGLLAGTVGVALGVFRRVRAGTGEPTRVAAELAPGDATAFRFPTEEDPALAVRLDDGTLVAYSSVCTHLACGVLYRPEEGDLYCPCHEGHFDAHTGEPVAGPPTRPLPSIRVEERPDGIWALETGP